MVDIEDILERALDATGTVVDGHDFGNGEMNIFITTNKPSEDFAQIAGILEGHPRLETMRAAYRPLTSDNYTILWPKGLASFSVS